MAPFRRNRQIYHAPKSPSPENSTMSDYVFSAIISVDMLILSSLFGVRDRLCESAETCANARERSILLGIPVQDVLFFSDLSAFCALVAIFLILLDPSCKGLRVGKWKVPVVPVGMATSIFSLFVFIPSYVLSYFNFYRIAQDAETFSMGFVVIVGLIGFPFFALQRGRSVLKQQRKKIDESGRHSLVEVLRLSLFSSMELSIIPAAFLASVLILFWISLRIIGQILKMN